MHGTNYETLLCSAFISRTGENELFGHINMNKYISPITQTMQGAAYPPLEQATCLGTRKLLYSFEFVLPNLLLFSDIATTNNNPTRSTRYPSASHPRG